MAIAHTTLSAAQAAPSPALLSACIPPVMLAVSLFCAGLT